MQMPVQKAMLESTVYEYKLRNDFGTNLFYNQ